ncbi:hypothetical protein [Bradyrhizobium sp.]|uniref:hypothetical protein n=1 Tax=Bradyrhizobium sp. TaxID=376 RepID=UPI003C402668
MTRAILDIQARARRHTAAALKALAAIMKNEEAPAAARISAAQALLDRAWGKPTQPMSGDEDGDPINVLTRIERVIVPAKPAEQTGQVDAAPPAEG